jgi:sulfate permease, SulP family
MAYVEPLNLDQGEHLFRQGEQADALYFVLAGRVSVILERGGTDDIRLRSMIGYTVVGEMGLYRTATRAASVIAEEPTRAFRLSRASLDDMEEREPKVASAFHTFIVRTLADRLNFANYEISALQR